MMMINVVASVVAILIVTVTVTATGENDIIETATANEAGIVIVTMMDLGPRYASGGQPAKAKIPRATMMTEAGGTIGGAKIVGGKMAEAGTASRSVTGMAIENEQGGTNESVGQVGMIGTHEVLNTEEGIQDDIITECRVRYKEGTPFCPSSTIQFRSVQQAQTDLDKKRLRSTLL